MMRKKLLLASLLGTALTVPALAQTEQGSKLIGVNVGNLSYRSSNQNNSLSAALYPSAGVFVTNNLLLGSSVSLSYYRQHFTNYFQDYRSRTFSYGLAPFARYYVPGSGRHRFFGQISAGVQRSSIWVENKSDIGPGKQHDIYREVTYGGALGYNYFITPVAALEVTAGYGRNTNGPNPTTGTLDVRAGFSLFLPSRKAAAVPTN